MDEWSAALNLSVAELRVLLRDGQEAKERIVKSNVRLVGAEIQSLKNRGGGRLYGTSSEADMVQEGCIALIKAAQVRLTLTLTLTASATSTSTLTLTLQA